MTDTLIVPDRPVLRDLRDVELLKVGSWPASTGQFDCTPADLAACVVAFQAPSVRKPVIKLGHVDPRFDGEPAVGFVDNLRLSDNGSTLVGDLCGLPAWLADICASAFPDRSIEGQFGLIDQTGRKHAFALTGLALLGVSPPAVGTLTSLNDVARLYGIEAAATPTTDTLEGTVHIMADTPAAPAVEEPAPDTAAPAAGTLSVEDIRREFYDNGPGANSWLWIEEMYIDPPELIAQDDSDGSLLRIPFSVIGTDVTWGEPEAVRREYVAAAHRDRKPARAWTTAALSRVGFKAAAAAPTGKGEVMAAAETTFPADEVAALTAALRLADTSTSSDIVAGVQLLIDGVTAALGLDETADIAAIVTATEDAAKAATDAGAGDTAASIAAAAQKRGMVLVDASAFAETSARAARGAELADRIETQERERFVASAVEAGKIPSSRREHWLTMLTADPSAREVLAGIPDNTVPMLARGYDGNADVPDTRNGAAYKALEG